MNDPTRDERLADLVGDEADADAAARLAGTSRHDPSLGAEIDSLRRTVEAMRSLDAPPTPVVAGRRAPPALRRWALTVARYAAVIGLAFMAGLLTGRRAGVEVLRDAGPHAGRATVAESGRRSHREALAAPPVEPAGWTHRAAEAYLRRPRGSSLARGLVALGRSASGAPDER